VLAPDNKVSIKEFMLNIDAIIASNKSLHKKVMIFDVLKKFTDLMSKKDAPHFMAKMKALAARGATIVLLAHTLKYMIEGKLMYDGVGDLRSDCDNMVYLYSSLATHKDAAIKIIETTTYADKTRATFKPMSFRMYASKDGVLVEPLEEVLPCLTDDLRIMLKAVSKALSHDIDTTEDIIKFCITETLHGTNKVRDMLRELVFMDNPKVFREVQQDRKTFKYFMQEFA
jgi:hypothetical protein